MVGPRELRDYAWGLTTILEVVLFACIVVRRVYRSHPAFSAYILVALLQGVVVAWSLRRWGVQSIQYFNFGWGAQAAVVCARWFAVAEIARRVLAAYSGIRKMAVSILFVLGLSVLVYSIAMSKNQWNQVVLNADRAVELCIATFIVALLVFARYYRLEMTNLERQLAIGFCLFSCSWVVGNSVYQIAQNPSGPWWEFFEIFAFLASLLIWINAVRKPVEVRQVAGARVLTLDQYGQLIQQLNARLDVLNSRLNRLFRSEDSRP